MIPVVAVGMITEFEQAEAIVGTGDADLVALARGICSTRAGRGTPPRTWAPRSKLEQYLRCQLRQYRHLFA